MDRVVRFLNLLILSLNTWSDVKHRISLSVTATLLTGVASLVVVSTVAADSSVKNSWLHHVQQQSEALPSDNKPQKSQASHGLPTRRHTELPIAGKSTSAIASQPNSAAPSSEAAQTANAESSGNTGTGSQASNSTTSPGSAQSGGVAQLAPAQLVCQQGQPGWSVASAQLRLGSPLTADGAVNWMWEVRMDSGSSTNASPIDTSMHSQTANAGQADIALTTNTPSDSLLVAPESPDYGYSFRLHVTAPVDVVSDWASVPQASGGC